MKSRPKIHAVLMVIVSFGLVTAACGGPKPTPTTRPTIPAPIEDDQPVEPDLVLIPAGEFVMGSDPALDQDAVEDEQPQHTLYLPDYYLAKAPVTNAQYAAFVEATGHRQPYHWQGGKPPRGEEDHPVVNVSWHDAVAYCNWLAEATGQPYRLPSEAEWEKGARGSDGRIYPWGNQWDAARCNSRESSEGDTVAVLGIYKGSTTAADAYPEGASPYGLLDMAGNVWEWTSSAYDVYPYDPADGREDLESGDDARRVLRGGASVNLAWRVRCAFRGQDFPDFFFYDRGFRLAMDAG